MKRLALFLFAIPAVLLAPAPSHAQHPTGIIDIEGRVIEQIEGRDVGVANVRLFISSYGDYLFTDANGRFTAAIPADGEPFRIELHHPQYTILEPPGGEMRLSDFSTARFKIELNILVRGMDRNEDLEKEIAILNDRIKQLQRENRLSTRQIAEYRQQMLDTILIHQRELQGLKEQLDSSESRNEALRQSLAEHYKMIAALRDSLARTRASLYDALEQQYLRQQKIYEDVSAGLKSFCSRAADFNDWMPRIKTYFSVPGAAEDYGRVIAAYNDIYNFLEAHHEGLLSGVKNYWPDPVVEFHTRQTVRFALEEVHRNAIYPGAVALAPFFAERPPKPGRAQKEADAIYERLAPLLIELQNKTDETLELLRNNL